MLQFIMRIKKHDSVLSKEREMPSGSLETTDSKGAGEVAGRDQLSVHRSPARRQIGSRASQGSMNWPGRCLSNAGRA